MTPSAQQMLDQQYIGVPKADHDSARRNAALDGIRFIAFFAVFLHHTSYASRIAFGASGVTLFFVLSGFLIGRILLAYKADDSQSLAGKLRDFYIRRTLRIFPLYYFVIGILAIAALAGKAEYCPKAYLGWHALYLSNLLAYKLQAWPGATSHFWSLSAEEHFYLIAPLAVLCLSNKALARTFAAIWLVVTVARWILYFRLGDHFLDIQSPMQFDSLTIGMAAAMVDRQGHFSGLDGNRLILVGKAAGGVVLAIALGTFLRIANVQYLYLLVWNWAFCLMSAALVLGLWQGRFPTLSRLLEWRPLTYLGTISYGLYIYHRLILAFVENQHWIPRHGRILIAFLLTVGISALSWHLLERPINNLKNRWTRPRPENLPPKRRQGSTMRADDLARAKGSVDSR